ncbi:MAG: hypothetical protein COA43_05960 [Robiginitomaculum sp.]|nr:MAG: hypothetical protein COA43_05960 [Robiginitomaculum sp.]
MSEISDLDLLKELGVELEVVKPKQYSPLEARLIAGFEDIQKFTKEHGRVPQHGENNDIFERLYAVRLDQLLKNQQALSLLAKMDTHGLLTGNTAQSVEEIDDNTLLEELGIELSPDNTDDITKLRFVSPIAHRQSADEIANRAVCRDFDKFEKIFEQIRVDLKTGVREARRSTKREDVNVGGLFILNGQIAYIAEQGKTFDAPSKKEYDARLRVIFDNGTESNLLLLSFQRALRKDEHGRAITIPIAGPLFSNDADGDNQTGTIYVLKSKSDLPEITPIRGVILKIGVTGGDVKTRIANSKTEATYLLGEVEVIDEYKLYNINRKKLEKMLHTIFDAARLKISIKDRFGNPFEPREWFLVTRESVSEAVQLIQDGTIHTHTYDLATAKFIEAKPSS